MGFADFRRHHTKPAAGINGPCGRLIHHSPRSPLPCLATPARRHRHHHEEVRHPDRGPGDGRHGGRVSGPACTLHCCRETQPNAAPRPGRHVMRAAMRTNPASAGATTAKPLPCSPILPAGPQVSSAAPPRYPSSAASGLALRALLGCRHLLPLLHAAAALAARSSP